VRDCIGGGTREYPDYFKFLNIVRKWMKFFFAGDDTGGAAKLKVDI
jgi:hypothetical protein